ncbi:MAG: serine/threonine-protein kinase [bacterium]
MDDRGPLDRLKSILERASDLPAAERGDLLDRECGADRELRREVERLLALHDAVGPFLPSGPSGPRSAEPARPPAPTAVEGRRIGPYTLLEKIGEGGFGTVYLAEQQRPIQRRVALKLVRAGASSAQVLARFEAERQVLALMDHPNIAVVYDAGVTDEGDPYFVMEHVAGPSITRYADDRRLGVEDRLRLFQQLCDAIQHAHQKGVIHRDLKPSNVLVAHVGGKPLVKVIDFGVAKALGARFTEETFQTQAGVVIGTPEYMSPEQASASPLGVDTRTDVYSLGVILYELLVGGLPFERSATPGENLLGLLQLIRDKEPPRLTTRLDSHGAAAGEIAAQRKTDRQALARRLRGDLESIVIKALEKDPARRYSSAATLAEDVGRHLANLPILARAPSTTYQIRKLVARHRAVAGLAATLVVALVGFGAAMSVMYHRQRVERVKAEHINGFLQDMLSAADPASARGKAVLARDILDRAAGKVSTELVDEPQVKAAVLATLADAYKGLGLPSEAVALGHSRVTAATQASGRRSVEEAAALDALGDAFLDAGHPDSALAAVQAAAAILEGRRRSSSVEMANTLALWGTSLHDLGQFAESEKLLRRSVEMYRRTVGNRDARYAGAVNSLSVTLEKEGRFAEAEAAQREALAIHQATSGLDSPVVLISTSNLAKLLKLQRKYAAAESLYRANIAVERRVLGNDHPILAKGLNNLAVLLKNLERYAEAESLYHESLSIQRRVLGNDHSDVAASLSNLGSLYVKENRFAEAEQCYHEALAIWVKLSGEQSLDAARGKHLLAGLLFSQTKLEPAEALERQALDTATKSLGASHPDVALYSQFLAQVLLERGRPVEAQKVVESCMAGQSRAKDVDQVSRAWSRNLLGQCLLAEGHAAPAETLLVGSVEALVADAAFARSRKQAALRATVAALTTLGKRDAAAPFQARLDSLAQR